MTDEKELDNFVEDLHETLIKLRDVRIEALDNLTEIQVDSRILLQHEAVRLEKKFGTEHPRTQRLKSSLKQNLDVINDLEVEKEIARIKIPEVSQDEALIHGRVVDANYRGIGGLMVCILDSRERILNDPEKSTTDDSGYYSIIIRPDKIEKMANVVEEGIFLAIYSSKGKVIHRQLKPIKINEGDRMLVEVVLNRDDIDTICETEKEPSEKPYEQPSGKPSG
ncbi:MAG: hypothetical protein ACM3QW_07595 [Ignavibacteriales bacterium]